jgi:hypothetical protein
LYAALGCRARKNNSMSIIVGTPEWDVLGLEILQRWLVDTSAD